MLNKYRDVSGVAVHSGGLRDRLIASDPGGTRFRMALAALVGVSTTLAVEYLFSRLVAPGQPALTPMLVGAVVAMMGSMGLSAPTAVERVRTGLFFPVAFGLGMTVSVAVGGVPHLALIVFVVVIFAAVYVRRFGPAFFHYGFLGWMGYFFGLFLHPSFGSLPFLLAAATVATAWTLLLSVTLLRPRPARVTRHALRAFAGRTDAVARAAADLLATPPDSPDSVRTLPRRRARLRSRQLRLAETALIVEGWLGDPGALPDGRSATVLRRRLIDAQAAVDALAVSADALLGADPQLVAEAGRATSLLGRGDHPGAAAAALVLLELAGTAAATDAPGWWAAQRLAGTVIDLVELARPWCGRDDTGGTDDTEAFTPVVTLVMGGLLPGSVATAIDVPARAHRLNPLRGLSLTTRQAVQVAVAGGLAIVLGQLVSPTRYYWAVLAAFLAFAGTATRSETVIKAFNRVLGTVVGLVGAILLAGLTSGNTPAIMAVILVSVFACFYLFTVHYAFMVFFVTILVSQMYEVLHQFNDELLVLRLEETAVGAAVGIVVALILVPTSTRDTVGVARGAALTALAELLGTVADRIAPSAPDRRDGSARPDAAEDGAPTDLGELTRALDDRLRQLVLIARPLTRPLVPGNDSSRVRDRLRLYEDCGIEARGLTMWLRRSTDAVPAELADAAQALADAAARLAEVGVHLPDAQVHAHLDRADAVLLMATRPDSPSADHPATRPLVRLHGLLHEIAVAVRADRPGAPAAPPRPVQEPGLTGVVRTPGGDPVAAGSVTLVDAAGQQAGHAELDADGGYRVPGRLTGQHILVASAPGHASTATRLHLGGTPERVDLTLHPVTGSPNGPRCNRSVPCTSTRRAVDREQIDG